MEPASSERIEVVDSHTEEAFFTVPLAEEADLDRAIHAARDAFDHGPWPRLTHAQRAIYLSAMAEGIRGREDDVVAIWPRQSGAILSQAQHGARASGRKFDFYAGLADTFPFEEVVTPTEGGEWGLLVRGPVGVVGAIIPWNGPLGLISNKIAPALLAGCTVIVKLSPEAPGEGYLMAEIAQSIGLPPGVLNVITADRQVSERLVRDPRVDKITFTGSTSAGRRIASICGDRVARCTLELGGKSAAIILDDYDLDTAADTLAAAGCRLAGQVCASLTRVIVRKDRHDAFVDALASRFSEIRVGDPYDPQTQMGPLVTDGQRDRVEGYIALGRREGARLATGGGRPKQLDRGWYVEPTVFGDVSNSSTIAREEIFGPVLCVIPADSEEQAVDLANDSIYGLNASVFSNDPARALNVARQLESGTVGHNAFRADFGIAFGGYKQSGLGREGGKEGLLPFFELKTIILNGQPPTY
jgi:aldehyde dehydrogenase (NAD+)